MLGIQQYNAGDGPPCQRLPDDRGAPMRSCSADAFAWPKTLAFGSAGNPVLASASARILAPAPGFSAPAPASPSARISAPAPASASAGLAPC